MAEFISAYRERLAYAVSATGGMVNRFWGDTMAAYWDAPDGQQDAANCVSAALLMRAILHSFNYGERRKPLIKIACGIDSGIITAGHIESEEQAAWTIVGEAAAGAERCENLNEALGTEILLTESAAALCGSAFITEEMPFTGGKRLFALINYRSDIDAQTLLEIAAQTPTLWQAISSSYLIPLSATRFFTQNRPSKKGGISLSAADFSLAGVRHLASARHSRLVPDTHAVPDTRRVPDTRDWCQTLLRCQTPPPPPQ